MALNAFLPFRFSHRPFNFPTFALFAAFCLSGVPILGHAQWAPLGSPIEGEGFSDTSGWRVALSGDGTRLAVGARGNDSAGTNAGHVRVFEWDGTAWVQLGDDLDGEAAGDANGSSVALSADGNRVAMGATGNDGNGSGSGHVRVYDWNGVAWVQVGTDIDGEAAGDASGRSVAMTPDGSFVAIGAISNDGAGLSAGQTRVFFFDGTDWVQRGGDIDGKAAGNKSGWSVALSSGGDRVAIGEIDDDGNGSNAGLTRVFAWDGSAWGQLGADIEGEAAEDQSGYSVALSANGNRLAVGATTHTGAPGADSGQVRLFEWDGSAWVPLGATIDGEAAGDLAGWSVDLSADGNRVAIGAPRNDDGGTQSGHARVFGWDGSAWIQQGDDVDGDTVDAQSGYAVSLSALGDRLAVGAPFKEGSNGASQGEVRVYSLAVTAAPALTLNPASIDFGAVPVGDSSPPAVVTLTNTGTAGLDVGSVSASVASFAVTGGSCATAPFTLAPAASCTLEYTFTPTLAGAVNGAVSVASNAASSPDLLSLAGEGTAMATFTVGGQLTGLSGSVTLVNNLADAIVLTADGAFAFPAPVADGASYSVTVAVQPADQTCTVSNGSGVIAGADVTDVSVECANDPVPPPPPPPPAPTPSFDAVPVPANDRYGILLLALLTLMAGMSYLAARRP